MPIGLSSPMTPSQRAESYGILGDLRMANQRMRSMAGRARTPLGRAAIGVPYGAGEIGAGMVAGMAQGAGAVHPTYDQTIRAAQFGGLTPKQTTSYGGSQRVHFTAPEPIGNIDSGQAAGRFYMAGLKAMERNPELSMTATGGVAGQANPNFPRITPEQLALNRADYTQRRQDAVGLRQQGVVANAQARADQRRIRSGNLTMEERMQSGIPGYAVAQQQRQAMEGVAGIQAGAQEKQIAAMERQGQLQRDFQVAMASGDRQAATQARSEMAGLQRDLKKMEVEGEDRRLASSDKRFDAQFGLQKRGVESAERKDALALSEQYRQSAKVARANKDFAEANRLEGLANQSLPQGMQQSAPGLGQGAVGGITASAFFPDYQERLAIQQEGPEALVTRLQAMAGPNGMPLSQEEADAIIQEMFPGTTVSMYDRKGFGLSNVIGGFGNENWNRLRAEISGGAKAPRIPGTQLPMPVIPGILGIAQQYAGY